MPSGEKSKVASDSIQSVPGTRVSETLDTSSSSAFTEAWEATSMTVKYTEPVASMRTGKFTVRSPRTGMVDERAWLSPKTSGWPALRERLTSESYGAKTPPKSRFPVESEEPIRTSTVAMGRPVGPLCPLVWARALLSVFNSLDVKETTERSLMLGRFRLRMSCPSTAMAMNGLAILPEGEDIANEKSWTPFVGTAISREAVFAGATDFKTQSSSVINVFWRPNTPLPGRSKDHSLAPSNPTSSRSPSGTEVRTNSASKELHVNVPPPVALIIRNWTM